MSARTIPHLLAVEDDNSCAEFIIRLAHKTGYSVAALGDSRALSLVLLDPHPDVITLDLSMPHINGIEMLSMLRDSRFHGQLIIVSGQPTCMRQHACEVARSHGLSVAGHLEKPIPSKELRGLLRRLAEDAKDPTVRMDTDQAA